MIAAAVEGVRVKIDQDATADLTAIELRRANLRGTVVDAKTKVPLARRPRSAITARRGHAPAARS